MGFRSGGPEGTSARGVRNPGNGCGWKTGVAGRHACAPSPWRRSSPTLPRKKKGRRTNAPSEADGKSFYSLLRDLTHPLSGRMNGFGPFRPSGPAAGRDVPLSRMTRPSSSDACGSMPSVPDPKPRPRPKRGRVSRSMRSYSRTMDESIRARSRPYRPSRLRNGSPPFL